MTNLEKAIIAYNESRATVPNTGEFQVASALDAQSADAAGYARGRRDAIVGALEAWRIQSSKGWSWPVSGKALIDYLSDQLADCGKVTP